MRFFFLTTVATLFYLGLAEKGAPEGSSLTDTTLHQTLDSADELGLIILDKSASVHDDNPDSRSLEGLFVKKTQAEVKKTLSLDGWNSISISYKTDPGTKHGEGFFTDIEAGVKDLFIKSFTFKTVGAGQFSAFAMADSNTKIKDHTSSITGWSEIFSNLLPGDSTITVLLPQALKISAGKTRAIHLYHSGKLVSTKNSYYYTSGNSLDSARTSEGTIGDTYGLRYRTGTMLAVPKLFSTETYTTGTRSDFELDSLKIIVQLTDVPLKIEGALGLTCSSKTDCGTPQTCTEFDCVNSKCVAKPMAAGSSCNDSSSTECNAPDTCDGAGTCVDRLKPAGFVCRASTGATDPEEKCDGTSKKCPEDFKHQCNVKTDCKDTPTTCNGYDCVNHKCELKPLASGTSCGDASSSGCNAPDTCNGAGKCINNVKPAGTTCPSNPGKQCDGRNMFCPSDCPAANSASTSTLTTPSASSRFITSNGIFYMDITADSANTVIVNGLKFGNEGSSGKTENATLYIHSGIPSNAYTSLDVKGDGWLKFGLASVTDAKTVELSFGDIAIPAGQSRAIAIGFTGRFGMVNSTATESAKFPAWKSEGALTVSQNILKTPWGTKKYNLYGLSIDFKTVLKDSCSICAMNPCGDPNSQCIPSGSGFKCACANGFAGTGYKCFKDSCAQNNGGCHSDALCSIDPLNGKSVCKCKPSYWGDGVQTCELVNADTLCPADDPNKFNICVVVNKDPSIPAYKNDWTLSFYEAKKRLEEVIVGDTGDPIDPTTTSWKSYLVGLPNKKVDDFVVVLSDYNGSGNVLGYGGSLDARCSKQVNGRCVGTAWSGRVKFNSNKVDRAIETNTFVATVIHEIMHALGFSALWDEHGLREKDASGKNVYKGEHGCAAYRQLSGCGGCPPLENYNGRGGGHWDERQGSESKTDTDFGHEMMTALEEPDDNGAPISTVTIASFKDLGYVVDMSKADNFKLETVKCTRFLRAAQEDVVDTTGNNSDDSNQVVTDERYNQEMAKQRPMMVEAICHQMNALILQGVSNAFEAAKNKAALDIMIEFPENSKAYRSFYFEGKNYPDIAEEECENATAGLKPLPDIGQISGFTGGN